MFNKKYYNYFNKQSYNPAALQSQVGNFDPNEGGGVDLPPIPIEPPTTAPGPVPKSYGFNEPPGTPNPYPTGTGYVPPPPGAGSLVPPPGVNMPPNEQPPPTWVKWASRLNPVIGAGYNAFRAGQRLGEMYRNKFGSSKGGSAQPYQSQNQAPSGYFSPAYLRSIGYEPGQGNHSLWPGAGPSAGPNGVGDYGVGGQGGSFFHQLQGGRATPVAGAFDGLGSFSGGMLPTSWGASVGARSPQFRGYLSAFGMTPRMWADQQQKLGGAAAGAGYTGKALNKSGD